MTSFEDEALAKKKGKKRKKKKKKKKKAPEEKTEVEDLPELPEPVKKEKPAWKGIGLAVGVAIGINAALLATVFIPFIGVIIVLMLAPYTAAFVGGRWLRREKKGDWLSATFWVVIIWPSIIMLIVYMLLSTLGAFDFVIEFFGAMIIGMIYIFPLIFTLAGFYQGSVPPEEWEEEEEDRSQVEEIERILGLEDDEKEKEEKKDMAEE
jgi:hypothetical protein